MVIKVDFDLTMSITAHNLYRLFAKELERYGSYSDQSIYEEFIKNSGEISIENDTIKVFLKKKRSLPGTLRLLQNYTEQKYCHLGNKNIVFLGASST